MDQRTFARWVSRVKVTDGCWEWERPSPHGYGQLVVNGSWYRAHRLAYEHYVGPIPQGMQIDHLCRNTTCVNPDHLEAVTSAENTRRGRGIAAINARKSHCCRGHEFTPENTALVNTGRGRLGRRCLACRPARRAA